MPPLNQPNCEIKLMDVTNARIASMEASITEVKQSVNKVGDKVDAIGQSLQILARIEERQDHVNARLIDGARTMEGLRTDMRDQSDRIAEIERHMPGLLELRRWMVAGAVGVIACVGAAVLALVVVR